MKLTQLFARLQTIFNKAAAQKTFLSCLHDYFVFIQTDRQLSEETIKKYKFAYNNIERYLISKGLKDLTCNNVRPAQFEELRAWLHANLVSCGKTHSSRHVEKCIAAMDYAVRMEWAKANPLSSLETGRDKRKPVVYLTKEEFTRWANQKYENEVYRHVQLLSIFQAATGLSYANLFDYTTRFEPETGLWIEDNRKKVGKKPFFVPLYAPGFEIAKAIHEEFEGKLPYMNRTNYNHLLKEMAPIVGIKKKLTTHKFRKTFATLMDQDGFELGVIAAILGNTEDVCRQDYIHPTKKKIERAFKNRDETVIIRSLFAN